MVVDGNESTDGARQEVILHSFHFGMNLFRRQILRVNGDDDHQLFFVIRTDRQKPPIPAAFKVLADSPFRVILDVILEMSGNVRVNWVRVDDSIRVDAPQSVVGGFADAKTHHHTSRSVVTEVKLVLVSVVNDFWLLECIMMKWV